LRGAATLAGAWLRPRASRPQLKPLAALLFAMVWASAAEAVTATGVAQAVKPYAFSLEGYTVYLVGVDSVEQGQTCTIDRRTWDCWAAAMRQLDTILSEGVVTCESVVGPDARQQIIAFCTVNGEDVGERFVRSGFGLSLVRETSRYEDVQAEAQSARRGLWQGEFAPPMVWRALPLRPPSMRPRFLATGPVD
jgi:endonuclease YncB( thermonuclease family)